MPLGRLFSFLTSSNTALSAGDLAFEITGLAANDGEPSAEGLVPGKDFRVFKIGKNDSEKGTFSLSPERAKAIDLAWKKRGVDVMLDYGHAVLNEDKGQPVPAMGWCKLEARPDGLYATDVKWTSEVAPLVKAGKIRYFSPLFEHDKAGNIMSLANIAVTGVPASHGISPLSQNYRFAPEDLDALATALAARAALASNDLEAPAAPKGKPGDAPDAGEHPAAPTTIPVKPLSSKEKQMPGQMPDPAAPNQGEAKVMSKLAKYLNDRMAEHDGEDLAKECGMRSDRMDAIKGGDMPSKEELSKLAKCLRVKESHLAALGADVDAPPQAPQTPAGKEAPAPAADNMASNEDPLEDTKPVQGLTALTALAKNAGPEVRGALMALIDSNKQVTALAQRLATIEKAKAEGEVAATVTAAIKDGKLIPAQKEWATQLGRENIKSLRSYLSVAPVLGPGVAAFTAPPPPEPSEADLDIDALKKYAAAAGKNFEEVKLAALEGLAADKKRLTALRASR